jgi:hypothetical protein
VSAALEPPLNVDHNASHEFWARVEAARADCVAAAQPL